jgi:PAS domain S-box-containing protein
MLIRSAGEVGPAPADAPAAPLPPPACADGPAGTRPRGGWAPDAITTAGGLLCAAVGVTVIAAWSVRATAVVRFGSQSEMAFNTALAFMVTGVALVALARGRSGAAMAAGGFDVLLGAAVLAEYVLGRGLGIDQLIVKDYLNAAPHPPGRMAVSAAVCTLLAGAALLARGPRRSRPRPVALAAAGSVIAVIAVAASFGHATSSPAAYGWTNATALSVPTAATMLILALALLSAAWRDSRTDHAGLPRWLPMAAGALGLGVVLWQVIDGRAVSDGRISAGTFVGVATVLGLVMAATLALTVWLAQQAEQRRQAAIAEAARRAEAELAARSGEHRLFQFLEAMPVGIHVALPNGQPYYFNGEAQRLLGGGVSPDVGAGELAETYHTFLAGTDHLYPAERMAVVRAALGQPSHVDDMEIHNPDGSVIPIEVWGQPVYGNGGEVDYAIAAFADVSERRAREKVIADQAALLDLAHDAIFVRDPGGHITYWNTGAERTYGYTRAQALGQVSHDLLRTRFPEPLPGIEAAMAGQNSWDGELTHRCADGRTIVVESRWAAQRDPGGSLVGFMEVNRDVTSRKDAEREMLRQSEEVRAMNAALAGRVRERTVHLERANNNLGAFTYSAAHNLRSPLRALSGFAEVLVEEYGDRLEETGRGYATRIQQATGQMAAVLDDLLHLSQVSRADMNLRDVDLSAEVTAICEQFRARDPGRHVEVTIQDGVRATADRPLIRIALQKLLENAWKFTAGCEQATIEFGATAVDDAPLCCYVRDNGVGFDPAYVGKLFEPFQRLHGASEFSGTGIGLASVQRIVDRHGGRTWAEGAVGAGATIYFTLDAKSAPVLKAGSSNPPVSPRLGELLDGGRGDRGEEVDEASVGVTEEQRPVTPGHGGGLLDDVIDPAGQFLVRLVHVVNQELDDHGPVVSGAGDAGPEQRHSPGAADRQGRARGGDLSEVLGGPGGGHSRGALVEADEALDVAGDNAD